MICYVYLNNDFIFNNQIGFDSCTDEWYCLSCAWNAKIEIWNSRIGERYLCRCCGKSGLLLDEDSPKYLNYERDHKSNESTFDFEKRLWFSNLE